MLQVAIKAVKIDPYLFGKSHKELCPELLPMMELLIYHGASASCLDSDGMSAVFYACVLGYEELFRVLIAAGADLSIGYQRSLPEQPRRTNNTSEQPSRREREVSNVNLLQITLDALFSVEDSIIDLSVDRRWGPDIVEAMWSLDLESTWGGIILRLLQEGLSYSKDDPGLVMTLHIACHQGALDIVEQLLGFGVATKVAGPRMVRGRFTKGRSFGTALHAAAANSQLPVAKLLIEHGESPCTRRQCTFGSPKATEDLTPVEMAMAASRYADDKRALLPFLEGMMQHSEDLEESDYQKMIAFCSSNNHIDFMKHLLQRGIQPKEVSADVGSLEMAQLLISHGALLDPIAVQENAIKRGQLDLLRWSVIEYGPRLPSDQESWGKMALAVLTHPPSDPRLVQYLVSEYPGPHIDAVLSADLKRVQKPTPTSWLHMAIVTKNFVSLLLESGADPTCPGLPFDAATLIRQNADKEPFGTMYLKAIKILESRTIDHEPRPLPSYMELGSRLADTIAKQRHAWDKRLKAIVDSRQGIPFTRPRQNSTEMLTTSPVNAGNTKLKYLPLHGKSSIRLMELLPSTSRTAPLSIRLIHSDITYQPHYEALSYVWGDVSESKYIYENGQAVSITPNLHSALTRLRYSSHIRVLWVDALCINQETLSERNQQVGIMGDIYKSARQVVVWLGEAADDSHLVFAFLNGHGSRGQGPRLHRAWDALVTRPWFFRTWVIQEVALSRKATIVCGEDSAPWRRIDSVSGGKSRGTSALSTFLDSSFWGRVSGYPHSKFDGDHHLSGSNVDHPLSGFDADNHVRRLQKLKAGSDPMSIMRYSRVCQTSEVKDRVYGILGLFEPGFIIVDYDLPMEEIFRRFTEALIRLTGNLRVLRHSSVGPDSKSLPSWVPDYTDTKTVGILPQGHGKYSSGSKRALTEEVLPGLAFRDGGALVIKGKIIDTIQALGPSLSAETSYAPGTEAFVQVMVAWESLVVTLIPRWQQSLASSVTKAFAFTLTATYQNQGNFDIDVGFTQWYRHCGTGILEAADPAMVLRDYEFYEWWVGVGQDGDAKTPEDISYCLRRFANCMDLACYGRRFFTTERGSMGLAGPRARAGDHIVFLPGGDQPFVLRRRDDRTGWTMANDCYLYGLDPYALFEDEEHVLEEFVIL
ncbi:hypothetical protein ACHAPT_006829 [Fusarium lateritium]